MTVAAEPRIEVGRGFAQGESSFRVGAEATGAAVGTIRRHALTVLIVYASVRYDLEELLGGVRSVVGDGVPVLGTTTAGEICDAICQGSVVVMALASPHVTVHSGVGERVSAGWERALNDAVGAPSVRPFFEADAHFWSELTRTGRSAFVLVFSPGNTRASGTRSFEILEALKLRSLGRLCIFGGSSADDWKLETNYVLHGGRAHPDSLMLAVFETDLKFGIALTHGFHATGRSATITAVDGHEVLTLDGLPARARICNLLGLTDAQIDGAHISLATGTTFGTATPMRQYSVDIVSYATPRGGVLLTRLAPVGTTLTLMESAGEATAGAASEAVRKAIIRGAIRDVALCLLNYCALRPRIMGERAHDEVAGVVGLMEGSPVAGFCSFGEQGVDDDGVSRHNNASVSCLVLGNELSQTAEVARRNAELLETLRVEAQMRGRTEEAIRQSEEKYRALVETTDTGYLIVDVAGRVLDANAEYVRLTGFGSLDEIVGRAPVEWTASHDRARTAEALARCISDRRLRNLEIDYCRPDGQIVPVEINATAQGEGVAMQIVSLCRDISERKRLQEELTKAQKLESIGTMAGGIAHDFNNLLQSVFGHISLARALDDPRDRNEVLADAEKAIVTAVGLTRQLLTFSKGGAPVIKPIDTRPVVDSAARFSLSGSACDLRITVAGDLRDAAADEGQIRQVIQNIVLNAREAMPDGGRVEGRGPQRARP